MRAGSFRNFFLKIALWLRSKNIRHELRPPRYLHQKGKRKFVRGELPSRILAPRPNASVGTAGQKIHFFRGTRTPIRLCADAG
jgi:hypothetical protein